MSHSIRTPEMTEEILHRLSEGEPLTHICKSPGMPKRWTVADWVKKDEEFRVRFQQAREFGADVIALNAKAIMDEEPPKVEGRTDAGYVAWQKARADFHMRLLAKWHSKQYGDKQLVGSDPDNPLPAGVVVTFK